ncbi:glycosyltransferase family 4 protein [Bordetella sp. FB-8]|uniref:glycosyltransferase family 4 protein n=1 Tax=Bordetella sp. FB-8 TaxID=1159870 RepID=UPI000374208A|nr:glycosyltransferase family 4 protein [Bordetella sp. FB-8]
MKQTSSTPQAGETSKSGRLNALLVAYHYLPENNGGVQRAVAMKRYLPQHGVDVTLLTYRDKLSAGAGQAHEDGVVRAFDATTRHSLPLIAYVAYRLFRRAATFFGVRYSLWRRNAIRHAERLISLRRPDVLIASYPPAETLDVALDIGQRHGIPVIADFRDGMIFEPLEPASQRTAVAMNYLNRMERRVISDAAAIVTISEPISEHYRNAGVVRVETIPNGFDPAEFSENAKERPAELDPDRINIVYTGRLDRSRAGTRIDALLHALSALGSEPAGSRLLLHFFGEYTQDELQAFEPFVKQGIVRVHGLVPRAYALALQQHADVLLLVTATGQRSIATGKLFEYLASGRPILALTQGTAAESIILETRAGWVIAPDDTQKILELLRQIAQELTLTIQPDKARIKSYERSEQMAQLAKLVREVVRR